MTRRPALAMTVTMAMLLVAPLWLMLLTSPAMQAEARFPSRNTMTGLHRVIGGGTGHRSSTYARATQDHHTSWNSLHRQSHNNVDQESMGLDVGVTDDHPQASVVAYNVLLHVDEFPTEIYEEGTVHNQNGPLDEEEDEDDMGEEGEHSSMDPDGNNADVPISDDDGDDNEGCTATAMKRHNAVGDDPSDNDASDSDEDDDLSMELSDFELEELTAEALSQAAAQSFLNAGQSNNDNGSESRNKRDEDDDSHGDIRTGHGDESISDDDEDDIDQVNIDVDIVLSPEEEEEELLVDTIDVLAKDDDGDGDDNDAAMTIDDVLLKAIQSHVYLPPTSSQLLELFQQQKADDAFSKKNGLDRRTFYRSLLLELTGEIDTDLQQQKQGDGDGASTSSSNGKKKKKSKSSSKNSKRKFLDEQTVARQLRSTLSMATQPRWRRHMMKIAHRHVHGTDLVLKEGSTVGAGSGIKLYEDDGISSFHPDANMGIMASCSMQETLLLALAHSLQCGMVTLDDSFFTSVRKSLAAYARRQNNSISKDEVAAIKNGDILDALFTFANQGELLSPSSSSHVNTESGSNGAKLSALMKRDLYTWEDPTSEGAQTSLKEQIEFETKHQQPQQKQQAISADGTSNEEQEEEGNVELDDELQAETEARRPLPLVVYLRADSSFAKDEMEAGGKPGFSSQKILQSKSSMDRLLGELKQHDSIHLICLGKECDFDTVGESIQNDAAGGGSGQSQAPGMDLESKSGGFGGGGPGSMFGGPPPGLGGGMPMGGLPPGKAGPGGLPGMGMPPGGNNPFLQAMQNAFANAGMNNRPNNMNNPNTSGTGMPTGQPVNPMLNGGFGANNNASGTNDPEGSQRFNIFLARTIDETGNPGIMGAVAPPTAGNVFPLMFNMMQQRQRQQQQQQQGGDGDDKSKQQNGNPNQFQIPNMPPWGVPSSNWQTNPLPGMQIPSGAQFFNASIHISGMTMNNNDAVADGNSGSADGSSGANNNNNNNSNNPWGNNAPPPEMLQKAMEMAMTQVVERLADANNNGNTNNPSAAGGTGGSNDQNLPSPYISNVQGNLPPPLAKAFSTILANEQLRRGIAENLSSAAPALLDPRCQGVMLSVYVPPGPEHPNRGKMPGGVGGMSSGTISTAASVNNGAPQSPSSTPDVNNKGSWFQKILSSPTTPAEATPPGDDSSEAATATPEKGDSGDEDRRSKLERKAAKRLLFKNRNKNTDKDTNKSSSSAGEEGEGEDEASSTSESASTIKSPTTISSAKSRHARAQSTMAKRSRNIRNIELLCHSSIPLPVPQDPVRKKAWNGWLTRQCNARFFLRNKAKLEETLLSSGLHVVSPLQNDDNDHDDGAAGNGDGPLRQISPTLRAMLSVKDCTADMTEVVRVAVEIEAERTLRNMDRPAGQTRDYEEMDDDMESTTPIHPSSIESALALVCSVTPHSSGNADAAGAFGMSAAGAPKRTREDLMSSASDKHERALCQNIVFPEHIGVTYDQIGGLDEVKELLRQSVTYPLKYPSLYSEGIARESCKGVLLFGPPGTGKTMLAKAVATEGGATFLSVDASSVENKWLGESEKNAKAVFTLARRLAPCVIFLDEVDSLLSSREGTGDDSAHGTLTSVKTTMMSEWDGLNSGTNGENAPRVIVIGSTNRPFDLDEAVLRRFPRRILVDLPDLDTRREILEVTMAENRIEPSVNFTNIAERLEGYTGSDIKEVCREAVVRISHEQAKMLDRGLWSSPSSESKSAVSTASSKKSNRATLAGLQRLRPVTMEDFEVAMNKLKRSVSEKGRELARVWEWNDEYGEIKRKDRTDSLPQLMNMFL